MFWGKAQVEEETLETEEEKTKEPKVEVIENDSEVKSDLTNNIAADKERTPIEITGDKTKQYPIKGN